MRLKIIPKQWLYSLVIAALTAFAVGTFLDLPINKMLYRPDSSWASFLYAFGQAPIYWCLLTSGLLLTFKIRTRVFWKNALYILLGILLSVFAVYHPVRYAMKLQIMSTYMVAVSALIVLFLPVAALIFLLRNVEQKRLQQFTVLMLVVSIGSFAAVSLIKVLFQRPRYIALLKEPGLFFQPWWMITEENIIISQKVLTEPDLFRSFPSGHTCSAATILCFTILPLYCEPLAKSRNLLFIGSIGYILLVAFSRMVLGYHFLTDVSAGFMITLLFFIPTYYWTVNGYKKTLALRVKSK